MFVHVTRPVIEAAAKDLAAAGVASPRNDAELLLAHVLGVARSRLVLVDQVDQAQLADFRQLVARRAQRIPLQHLTGFAAMGEIDLAVGPGVFIPRLETELLLEWALDWLTVNTRPRANSRSFGSILRETAKSDSARTKTAVVLDLCAGSGALALAIAHVRPDAEVHAVELDSTARSWIERNSRALVAAGDRPITLHAADVTDPELLSELTGRVDLVVSNPPYIPLGAVLEPEVLEHDPHLALFGGTDGLDVIRGMVPNIARLLRPGGGVGIEHDDSNGGGVARLLTGQGFTEVVEHLDLASKPRFVTARRGGARMGA